MKRKITAIEQDHGVLDIDFQIECKIIEEVESAFKDLEELGSDNYMMRKYHGKFIVRGSVVVEKDQLKFLDFLKDEYEWWFEDL